MIPTPFIRLGVGLMMAVLLLISAAATAQCESEFTLILKNQRGGFFSNQVVTMTRIKTGETFDAISDGNGKTVFQLPCASTFSMEIENYPRAKDVRTPDFPAQFARTLTYAPDVIEKEKLLAMSEDEKTLVDLTAKTLPDSIMLHGAHMPIPVKLEHVIKISIQLEDFMGQALKNEAICLTGKNNGKTVCGKTDTRGFFHAYVPKGDTYSLNFKHHPLYDEFEARYTLGTAHREMFFSYLGTPEIERRMRLERERILAEERRLKEEEEKFKEWCKARGLTLEEGRLLELKKYMSSSNFNDTVVSAVFNRNQWDDKLIVCDLTGSMMPYSAQLSAWFLLHHKMEKNLQFVFFNDGDAKRDADKVIGKTGGIYYLRSEGAYEPLARMVSKVSSAGCGGDCPENNMEALIKGVYMADDFRELVMIVDNNAPVKDIELLDDFDTPVHIVLCGSRGSVLTDYLLIAWKTGGSIHTMEEDLHEISKMAEGETIMIGGNKYVIMAGEFVQVTGI